MKESITYPFIAKHIIPSLENAMYLDLPTNIVIPVLLLLTPLGPEISIALVATVASKTAIAAVMYAYRSVCNEYWGEYLKENIGDIGRASVCGAPAGFTKYASGMLIKDFLSESATAMKDLLFTGFTGAVNNVLYEYYKDTQSPFAKVTVIETMDCIIPYARTSDIQYIITNFIGGVTMAGIGIIPDLWSWQKKDIDPHSPEILEHWYLNVSSIESLNNPLEELCNATRALNNTIPFNVTEHP